MVIPFGAIVFIIHFKMSMLISEYKDKSKTSHGSYRTTNTSRLLSRAENDNRYSRQSLLHCQMKKDLNVKLRVKEKNKKPRQWRYIKKWNISTKIKRKKYMI
jgi:hypothetical protein